MDTQMITKIDYNTPIKPMSESKKKRWYKSSSKNGYNVKKNYLNEIKWNRTAYSSVVN